MEHIEANVGNKSMTLVGCGILSKEIRYLIKKNKWSLKLRLSDSSLHINFKKLQVNLEKGLEKYQNSPTIVFYGTCHPLMDKILLKRNAIRTPGQNCVEILLGKAIFTRALENGAFFLMEDWAKRFEHVTGMVFDDNPDITRQIFQLGHTYLLGIRTICSSDFTDHAQRVSRLVGLPLHWMDVDLEHLEKNLGQIIEQKTQRN